jgi:hypothetical protein
LKRHIRKSAFTTRNPAKAPRENVNTSAITTTPMVARQARRKRRSFDSAHAKSSSP